jgi:hypothetical protein
MVFRVFNNTHSSRQLYTDLSSKPVWNANQLQTTDVNPNLALVSDGDVLLWDGATEQWTFGSAIGPGVEVSFGESGILTNVLNASRQYDKIVQIQITATVAGGGLVANVLNFVGTVDFTKRPTTSNSAISINAANIAGFIGFEGSISATNGDMFITPGANVAAGSIIEIQGSYTSV